MRTMTLGMMIGLLAAVFVPMTASASLNQCDPTFTVCVGDDSFGYGDCSNGYDFGYTYADAFTPAGYAFVEGFGYCSGFGGYTFNENAVYAFGCTAAGCFAVEHFSYDGSFGSYCDTYVFAGPAGGQDLGCPAGPLPNPGWGHLTP